MSKALEALEKVKDICWHNTKLFPDYYKEDLDIIETELKRLNYIDENKLSDEDIHIVQGMTFDDKVKCIKKIKAFDIIKENNVCISVLKDSNSFEEYNNIICYHKVCSMSFEKPIPLTQFEFDLLKEWFK